MVTTENHGLQKTSVERQKAFAPSAPIKKFVSDYSANEIKEALLPTHELTNPLEELIAISDAVFEFIHQSEISTELKNSFYRLQKQFDFYRNMVV